MKFFVRPTLALMLLAFTAVQDVQAQDTLRVSLQEAVRIALSDNPTIKVAGQEIQLKKEARREAYAGLFPEASLVGSYSRHQEAVLCHAGAGNRGGYGQHVQWRTDNQPACLRACTL